MEGWVEEVVSKLPYRDMGVELTMGAAIGSSLGLGDAVFADVHVHGTKDSFVIMREDHGQVVWARCSLRDGSLTGEYRPYTDMGSIVQDVLFG